MLGCLDWLEKESLREGRAFKGAVDVAHVGASGHSQGGTGAIMAGHDPRVVATVPIQLPTIGGEVRGRGRGEAARADAERNHAPVFADAKVRSCGRR